MYFLMIMSVLNFGIMLFGVAFKEFVLINPQSTNIIGKWVISLIPTFAFVSGLVFFGVFIYKTMAIPAKISSGLINRIRKNNVTIK